MRINLITCTLVLTFISSASYLQSRPPDQKKPTTAPAESTGKDALRKEIEAKLNEMFSEQFNVDNDKIKPEARLVEDFKAEPNDIVEMIMRVEYGFEIEVSYIDDEEDIEKLKRVSDFYDFVEKKLREKLKKPKPTDIS